MSRPYGSGHIANVPLVPDKRIVLSSPRAAARLEEERAAGYEVRWDVEVIHNGVPRDDSARAESDLDAVLSDSQHRAASHNSICVYCYGSAGLVGSDAVLAVHIDHVA